MDTKHTEEKTTESERIATNRDETKHSSTVLIFDGFVIFCLVLIIVVLLQNAAV